MDLNKDTSFYLLLYPSSFIFLPLSLFRYKFTATECPQVAKLQKQIRLYIYMSGIGKQKKYDVQNIKYTVSINEILYGWDTNLCAVPERAERAVAAFVECFRFWSVILLHPAVAVSAATGFINV
jgi:hypothetical protein